MKKQKTKAGRKITVLLLAAAMLFTMQGIPVLAETAGEAAKNSAETPAVKSEDAVERTGETRELPSDPVHNCTKQNDGTDTTKWSYVYFGSYPQTEVTGNALTAAITGASYDANGDAWVNGTKYRRISKSDTNYDGYFGNSEYRYFKWERIKWRVLRVNGSTMFVVADKGLDCKDYNEEYTSVTWETCTLRNWLNNDFYGTAFSSSEQGAIISQTVVNEDNPYYNTEGGNNTWDKVYLLSISEVMNPDYGFCEGYTTYSVSRRVKASDYAHAMGAYVGSSSDYAGNCWWWLRSPGYDTYGAAYVDDNGYISRDGYDVINNYDACVPALHINLSSDLWSMADDGSSGEGGGSGTGDDTSSSNNDIIIRAIDHDESYFVTEKPIENARVTVENFGNASTGADGRAVIENNLTDQPMVNSRISVTKEGYREYYFYQDIYNKNAQMLWNNNTIGVRMRKLQENDTHNPYISTLMCQTSYGKYYDAMISQQKYKVLGSSQNISIQMNAVWNNKTPTSYVLYQENGISYTSTDGKFQLDMGEAFKSKFPIYAKLIASDGTTVTEKTQFVIEGSSTPSSSGNSLDLIDTDSTGTLGEDVSFLSGESVSIKLKKVKIDASVESGKVKVVIGANKTLSEGDYLKDQDWEDWKKLCECQPKDLNLSQWKNVIDSLDTNWTSSATGKTEVYGYMEGVMNSSGDTILTGKLKLKASLSVGIQAQYTIGVVPVYAKVSLGADGGAEGALTYNWTKKEFDLEKTGITLSLEPTLAAEGGVGVMAVATVGVEGKGSLPFSTKLGTNDNTKLSVKGGLSLKAKLLAFEYSLKLAEKEWQLLPTGAQRSADAVGLSELSMDDFQLSEGMKNEEERLWLGEERIQTLALDTTETGSMERILETNSNPDAGIQIIDTGSTKMILWTETDADRETINSSKLVYSIYNETEDTWSAPIAVADDGTADYAPSAVTDGEQIYVAWQNISGEFDNTAELSEVAAASTIAMSVWTKENGFSNAVTVSEPDFLAASPKVAINAAGRPYVAYLQNTENNLLFTTGKNNILYSVIDGSSIEHKTYAEDAGLVTAIATAYTDDYEISYTLDTDQDLSTLNDREIIIQKNSTRSTQNEFIDSNVQYVKNGNQMFRFWYRDDSIVMSDDAGAETVIYQDDTGALTDDFHVVNGAAGQLAVVWTAVDEEGNKQIEGSLYDSSEDVWSKSIRISDTDASIYNPQGIFTEDGNLQFLYKKTGAEQTDLCILMAEPSVNLALENAYADETIFVPGSMAKISVQVKNNGSKKTEGYTIDIDGTETAVSESLAPGESAVVEADYMVPSNFDRRTIAVTAECESDVDQTDNRFELEAGYTDLAVNLVQNRYEFGEVIEIYAANESCVDTSAVLEIRKGSREGELVKTIDLGTVSRGALAEATYIWNENTENYSADTEALYFDVVSEKPEQYTNNNYDFVVVEKYIEPGEEQEPGSGGDEEQPDSDTALATAKEQGKTELENYKNPADYREAQKIELAAAIAAGKAAIDAATNEAGVSRALAAAKSVIDQIKTNAQLLMEEEKKGGNNTEEDSNSGKVTVPKATSIKGKIIAKKKAFLVKWKKQTGITGYQIQYSTNKKFKNKGSKIKTVKKPSTTKLTVKKLKSGKKYYVRIRTYKTVNGTSYYSEWSKAKKVKIKR